VSQALPNSGVISADDSGNVARCTYRVRGMKHVVVLPLDDIRLDKTWKGIPRAQ
jgi:hypothetical protein